MNKLRILIAEDEYLVLMGLKSAVEELGHEVIGEANNGELAIQLAKELKPDLILMDIKMPTLDGINATYYIQKNRPVPIIIISGYAETDLVDKASSEGVMGYLVKPVSKKELEPALAIAVNRFFEMQRLRNESQDAKMALENRKLVEKAKGIIMARLSLPEASAMKYLQQYSRRRNQSLIATCVHIVFSAELEQR